MKRASCSNRKRAKNLPRSLDKRRKIWVLTSPKHRSVLNHKFHCSFAYGNITSFRVVIGGPSAEEARAIREAVANASTLEEVERLNQMLRAGIVPGKAPAKNGKTNGKIKFEMLLKSLNIITCEKFLILQDKKWKKKRKRTSLWVNYNGTYINGYYATWMSLLHFFFVIKKGMQVEKTEKRLLYFMMHAGSLITTQRVRVVAWLRSLSDFCVDLCQLVSSANKIIGY